MHVLCASHDVPPCPHLSSLFCFFLPVQAESLLGSPMILSLVEFIEEELDRRTVNVLAKHTPVSPPMVGASSRARAGSEKGVACSPSAGFGGACFSLFSSHRGKGTKRALHSQMGTRVSC